MLNDRDIGKMITSQLFAILHDTEYSYVSTLDPQYSHLTEAGEKIMLECIRMMIPRAVAFEQKKMQEYAERVVMNNLSK